MNENLLKAVKSSRKLVDAKKYKQQGGLILLFYLCWCSQSANAHPKLRVSNSILLTQNLVQRDLRSQAQQFFDEGSELSKQGTFESSKQAISKWEAALALLKELDRQNPTQK